MSYGDSKQKRYSGLVYRLFFSIYFALLGVSFHEELTGFRWAIRIQHHIISNADSRARPIDDNLSVMFADFALLWISALAVLLIISLFERFDVARRTRTTFAGLATIAGFPIAKFFYGENRLTFLELEVFIAAMCVLLFVSGRWSLRTPATVVLLFAHFSLWAAASVHSEWPGWILFWPRWQWVWRNGRLMPFVYPVFGLLVSLLWGANIMTQRRRASSSEVTPPS